MKSSDAGIGKVLIVDDQESNVVLLEDILDEAGVGSRMSVTDGRAALGAVAAFAPDLVLLDLMMPHVDGFQVLAGIRSGADPELPVIMLTADDSVETKRRALAAGASDFLAKPFDPVEAMLRIANLLEARRLSTELAGRNRELEARVAERTAALEAQARELEAELATKRGMLRELNHRVRNNLAVVASMLNLQALRSRDEAAKRAISSCRDRIHVMSLAHEALYDESLAVSLACEDLLSGIVEYHRQRDRGAGIEGRIDFAGDSATVGLDSAVPLSLILNELLSNARDHAGGGELSVRFEAGPEELGLEVRDAGKGLPEGFDIGAQGGFGLALVRLLVDQVGGSIEADSPGGARFRVSIPRA